MALELTIINLDEAKFECTFGRGCDGICCREGRPPVYADEVESITAHLHRFLPLMRVEARTAAKRSGFLVSRQRKNGQRVMRLTSGWCIFFNQGCVLQHVGASEGDPYRYKPSICSLFPIQRDNDDQWYVRQKGYKGERWNLPCLDPKTSAVPARESLRDEIALAEQFDEQQKQLEAKGIAGV
jgi:hypothetical protein